MIHLIIALPAEARSIIDYYGLKVVSTDQAFRIYENKDIRLIIAGIGKTAAAAASAYLYAQADKSDVHAWLNIGIAGHATRALGECVLGHKITDNSTGNSWYPVIVFEPPCDSDNIVTIDQPSDDYSEAHLTEMEAAGFYQTTCRFTTAELIHCCKIVSDNRQRPAKQLSKQTTRDLIGDNLGKIDHIITAMRALQQELHAIHARPEDFERFLKRWHFTQTQQHQLLRLLHRWQTLSPDKNIWLAELEILKHGKDVLQLLQNHIQDHPVKLA